MNPVLRFLSTGDLGVDIFFTISGFLIAFILLKECEKYGGKIDWFNFMRGRFWRIWPALALAGLPVIPMKGIYFLLDWVFLNNTVLMPKEGMSHFWSIAVEMQMYIFSPWLMMKFYKMESSKVWMVPLALCLYSSICNFAILKHYFPGFYQTGVWVHNETAMSKFMYNIYMASYCRMSPYGFGMLAAYRHLEESKRSKFQKTYEDVAYILSWKCIIFELISFALVFYTIWFGCIVTQFDQSMSSTHKFSQVVMGRQIFSLGVAYLLYLMVSPNSDQFHAMRPVNLLRKFMSSKILLPFASLSYSMYLWHIMFVIVPFQFYFIYPDWTKEKLVPVMIKDDNIVEECPWDSSIAVWSRLLFIYVIGLIPTMIFSLISYLLVEKPAIDARKVFKNKYDDNKVLPK